MAALTIEALNALDVEDFVARLAHIYERSPWVARAVYAAAPFANVAALHAAMARVVEQAGADAQLALLCEHPELGAGATLTEASAAEQGQLGLTTLDAEEAKRFAAENRVYREVFGFPFIIAVRGQKDRRAILAALDARLRNTKEAERAIALAEVNTIARFRLEDLFGAGWTGRLTTHVLDTARGRPAAGVPLNLYRLEGEAWVHLGHFQTDADGRSASPLLEGEALRAGQYELVFDVGAWRAAAGQDGTGFYDQIPVRFRVDDPAGHYHVPLILAPFGYSTYRGS